MANADTPFGLKPIRHLDGTPWNGKAEMYNIPASDGTAVFLGDAVKSAGSADANGIPTVKQAAAGDNLLGVVVGVMPTNYTPGFGSPTTIHDSLDLQIKHRKASTNRYVLVVNDPNVVYEVQEDSDGGALDAADVGNNVDLVVGSGSATTGISAMQLDSSTKATTSAQMRVLRLVQRSDNDIGAKAKWECLINEHEYKTTTGT